MANISREERARREAEKARENENGTGMQRAADETEAFQPELENPRVHVDPAREGAEPKTPAAGGVPAGSPNTVDVEDNEDTYARTIVESSRVPMSRIKMTRTYFTDPDRERWDEGTEHDLPREEARYLVETGVAAFVDHVGEPTAKDDKR